MVHSPDRDTEFFDNVIGVLQRDTLTPILFILCLDYILRTSTDLIRENGFTLKKPEADDISQNNVTGTNYTDDLTLLLNRPA